MPIINFQFLLPPMKVRRKSLMKSPTATTTTIASPSPHMNKYDDPASFMPMCPEKKSLPGLQQPSITVKLNPKLDTMSSDSTMPLPPPILQTEVIYQVWDSFNYIQYHDYYSTLINQNNLKVPCLKIEIIYKVQ